MGSGGSTARPGSETADAASSSFGRRGRLGSNWGFQMSCLGSTSGSRDREDDDQVCNHRNGQRCNNLCQRSLVTEGVDQLDASCYKVLEDKNSDDKNLYTCLDVDHDDCHEARAANMAIPNGTDSAQTSNIPSGLFSDFRFIPGNISSRLNRASSSRSLNSYPASSTSLSMLNGTENVVNSQSQDYETESQQGSGLLPVSRFNRVIRQDSESASARVPHSNDSTVHFSDSFHDNQRVSSLGTPTNASHWDAIEPRYSDRRVEDRESFERNVRFSRTLSVGRLRDRVLQRSSLSEFAFCPLQLQGEISHESADGGIHTGVRTRVLPPEEDHGLSSSGISRSMSSLQDRGVDASRSREARYHDLLEHRSNFAEQRRRIRSQVRTLRRLGSRFDNAPGHDRSCALSRQNQTASCTCVSNRNTDSTNETGARASISRIVMLAEALFEVLDDIHQQSVVLSSQPSVSSIGSIPAPTDVVDSLSIKPYTKSHGQKHEDMAQCYICLVEYEEGDSIRILPCRHEFHRNCVDKWLKEIHRVCPLCRGDICKSNSFPGET